MADFWLNSDEKVQFKKQLESLRVVRDVIERANQKGIEAGISKNQDGCFSARSKVGKEIRATLEKYEPIKRSLTKEVIELRDRPIFRWEIFNGYVKKAQSFMAAFFSWIATLLYYFVASENLSILDAFLAYIAWPVSLIGFESTQLQMADGGRTMILVSTGVAIGAYFLFASVFKNAGEKYTPKPEQVSLDNIDGDVYWKSGASEKEGKYTEKTNHTTREKIAMAKANQTKSRVKIVIVGAIFLIFFGGNVCLFNPSHQHQ